MAVEFRTERGDLHFQATFSRPMFALWRSSDQLFELLFRALSKHGLQLNDLKWAQSTAVGDVQLNFYLFNYAAAVRIRIDRVEIEVFNSLGVDEEHLQDAATALINALKAHNAELSLVAYVVAVGYHGRLASGSSKDFTRALTAAAPEAAGPSTGAGVVFYYGPSEDRVSSAVTIDLSAVLPEALFFRVQMVWDASRVEIGNLAVRTRQYGERVFEAFGLIPVAAQ
jgi:hypothetical protein